MTARADPVATDRARFLWSLVGAGRVPAAARPKLAVVALLYFLQGSPVSVLWEVLPVYFRLQGVSLGTIGGLRLLELPFSLKVLWSPLVQRFGDRRGWVVACMTVVALVVVTLSLVDVARPGVLLLLLLLVLTTASATQDIAIDSYTVALVDPAERGAANGVRASAYRVALVLIGGGMVTLAAWIPWSALFVLAGSVFVGLGLAALRAPRLDVPAEARRRWLSPFVGWIATWRAVPLVGFVLTYKLGEFALGPMAKPFWVDRGRSLVEIGLVPTTLGIVLSIAGALAGGAFIARYGVFTSVWALGAPQALSNLGYAAVAAWDLPWPALYAASMIDSFSGGLGTAAFLALLMSVCNREHATIQYAFLSSLFSLTGRLAGAASGLGVERWGYPGYFAFTFVLSLPAYALLPWIAPWVREEGGE
ncbi:MAG: MFS transporter [Candidatus Rokubacteria bacterium]|nr:MFS transporter [Candidatus Rokubacteria bacterium]